MSIFGKSEARPYVVTLRDKGGTCTEERVVAYDSIEASLAALTRANAAGMVEPEVVDFRPDEEGLARQNSLAAINAVAKLIEQQSRAKPARKSPVPKD